MKLSTVLLTSSFVFLLGCTTTCGIDTRAKVNINSTESCDLSKHSFKPLKTSGDEGEIFKKALETELLKHNSTINNPNGLNISGTIRSAGAAKGYGISVPGLNIQYEIPIFPDDRKRPTLEKIAHDLVDKIRYH